MFNIIPTKIDVFFILVTKKASAFLLALQQIYMQIQPESIWYNNKMFVDGVMVIGLPLVLLYFLSQTWTFPGNYWC